MTSTYSSLPAALVLASALSFAILAAAAQAEPIDGEAPVVEKDAARSAALRQVFADEFDQAVLGGKGPEAAAPARRRLDAMLTAKTNAIEAVCGLTAVQKQKLE